MTLTELTATLIARVSEGGLPTDITTRHLRALPEA
jgi:hypothetical protein